MEILNIYPNPERSEWAALTERCTRREEEITRQVASILDEVRTGGDEALLPVRTAEAIPLELHAQAMNLIRGLVVNAPIRMGDVVLEDLLDTSINLIASMDINRAQVAN